MKRWPDCLARLIRKGFDDIWPVDNKDASVRKEGAGGGAAAIVPVPILGGDMAKKAKKAKKAKSAVKKTAKKARKVVRNRTGGTGPRKK